jgi:hypothetical protein
VNIRERDTDRCIGPLPCDRSITAAPRTIPLGLADDSNYCPTPRLHRPQRSKERDGVTESPQHSTPEGRGLPGSGLLTVDGGGGKVTVRCMNHAAV